MRYGRNVARRLALLASGMTLFALVSESVWGGADGAMPRRGEIVIKPTGRKVRVVTITPAAPATAPSRS